MSNNILLLSNIKGNFEKIFELFKKLEKTGKKVDILILIRKIFWVKFFWIKYLKSIKIKNFYIRFFPNSSVLKYKIKYKTYSFLII